jgi:integrase
MKTPPKGIGLYLKVLDSGIQKYESRIWNPALKRVGIKKVWNTADLSQAIRLHLDFKEQYLLANFNKSKKPLSKKYPSLIIPCAGLYEAFLNDNPDLVPPQKAKNRSKKYIQLSVMYLSRFLENLKNQGCQLSHTEANIIDDTHVSVFYEDMHESFDNGEFAAATWNKTFKACQYWYDYLLELGIVDYNPFRGVRLKTEYTDPPFATLSELNTLLSIITPENGSGQKGSNFQTVNHFRDWFKTYIIISVFVGGRRDQMTSLRWTDWQGDYIKLTNSKVDKAKNEKGNIVYIYVHPELAEALSQLYKSVNDDHQYILVPDWENRTSLKQFVTKAFKHFWTKTGINKHLTLHNLRHTYINALYNMLGEDGFSVHNKKETAIRNYLSKKKRLELEQGKSLFNIDSSHLR